MNKKEGNDEIDLGLVLRGIRNGFNKLQGKLFDLLFLFVKFKYVISAIIGVGFVFGYYLDNKETEVKYSEVVVIPNYNSSEYLYSHIEMINTLFSKNNKEELKEIFGEAYKGVHSVSIKPINDLRLLVESSELMDLLKESVKDNRLSWIQEEFDKGRIQKHHSISMSTNLNIDVSEVTNHLIKYLNNNAYFKQIRLISLDDVAFQLEELERTLDQIDTQIANTSNKNYNSTPASQSLFFSNHSELSSLFEYKSALLEERYEKLRRQTQMDEVIQLVYVDDYLKPEKSFMSSSYKISLPVMLVGGFISFIVLISYLKHISKFSRISNKKRDN